MTRRVALLSLLLASMTAHADAAADAAATARLEAALDGLASLQARFRQTVTDAQGRLTENADGTVALARPGKFRWDYREPEQLIVSDGETVWFYDVGLEQVTVRAAAETIVGTPALLLSGEGNLDAEFEVSDGGEQGGLRWSVLKPRDEEGDFRELRVGLDGGQIARMTLLDRLGQVTELAFDAVQRNPRLDASLFRFTPPPGVDVVGRAASDRP
jgi:outer membrane lipoprotein carrier protein